MPWREQRESGSKLNRAASLLFPFYINISFSKLFAGGRFPFVFPQRLPQVILDWLATLDRQVGIRTWTKRRTERIARLRCENRKPAGFLLGSRLVYPISAPGSYSA